MKKSAKDIVKSFYNSDLLKDENIIKNHFHPELTLIWNSADGMSIMNYEDISLFFEEIRKSYADMRVEISHILEDDTFVTIRYKYYIRALENPDEELGIAHFIAIWEIKDNKLYKGYQVSQPVTKKDETKKSYHRVKV
ncbi:MAG: hypothetical protein CVU03_06605 [Bacteroidetes bacterium HGW-Bacteroidetes-2]|jgi:hypothetical protein|nr:MAG: hypothetical protein CVU03_06605 [Bacteroidetes bacterium HGW-Bacteroidetes-2]